MNLDDFVKMQMASKAFNSPYANPSYLNDFVCIPELLKGLPDELIHAEQYWWYCYNSFSSNDDAVAFYFHGMGIGKW